MRSGGRNPAEEGGTVWSEVPTTNWEKRRTEGSAASPPADPAKPTPDPAVFTSGTCPPTLRTVAFSAGFSRSGWGRGDSAAFASNGSKTRSSTTSAEAVAARRIASQESTRRMFLLRRCRMLDHKPLQKNLSLLYPMSSQQAIFPVILPDHARGSANPSLRVTVPDGGLQSPHWRRRASSCVHRR
jgi:hypothetical protein